MNLAGLGMYEGYTHLCTLLLLGLPLTEKDCTALRETLHGCSDLTGGLTQLGPQDHLVRMLGYSAQTLMRAAEGLVDMLAPYLRAAR